MTRRALFSSLATLFTGAAVAPAASSRLLSLKKCPFDVAGLSFHPVVFSLVSPPLDRLNWVERRWMREQLENQAKHTAARITEQIEANTLASKAAFEEANNVNLKLALENQAIGKPLDV